MPSPIPWALALLAVTTPARAMEEGSQPLALAWMGLMAAGMLLSLTLATLAWRRSLQPAGMSRAEAEELRRSVSAFATLLRDGSAVLLKTHHGTLESAQRVAIHSEQLIALVAGSEARLANATERGEILATRVARSAAAEIRSAVQGLNEASARIEQQQRGHHSPG